MSDSSSPSSPRAPQNETDERFPSGRWTGFWLQRNFANRQRMRLSIEFVEGKMSGHGSDVVGDFTLAGTYDLMTGRCRFTKSYVGEHSVEYEGANQNDGMWIWGTWRIRSFDHGGFHIWPEGEEDPTRRHLKEEADLPVEPDRQREEGRRVLVPAIGEPGESDAP